MPKYGKNNTVYTAINLADTPEDLELALKVLREFGESNGAPEDFDFDGMAQEISEEGHWIIQHPTGFVTFITDEQFVADFDLVEPPA
jgi:hypothetical protein